MKNIAALLLAVLFVVTVSFAQTPSSAAVTVDAPVQPRLTTFDLDFPGGTPGALVAAIEKATGKPLNAVIPAEDANRILPALRMRQVNVRELFDALAAASIRQQWRNGMQWSSEVGFRTLETNSRISDDSIWYFRVKEPATPPPVTRFYLLRPYLERGLTVDDITTAVQTAWKLRGDESTPKLNFHQETQLLIAAGESWQLSTIDDVLNVLAPPSHQAPAAPEKKESK